VNMGTKLAAALLQMRDGLTGGRLIPYDHAKKMTARQIISLFEYDHYPIAKSEGGPDEPWNLRPMLIPAHRERTRKHDLPRIAKNKRVRARHERHLERMRTK
jgi:hypothetical protein